MRFKNKGTGWAASKLLVLLGVLAWFWRARANDTWDESITRQNEFLHSSPAVASTSIARRGLRSTPAPASCMVVGLLDGSVVALHSETGQQLWKFDSGSPLVSSFQSQFYPEGGQATIFPGVDGGLYVYRQKSGSMRGLEKLPVSVPELVAESPSMATDGSVILGSRHSTVYVLDKVTGELLRTYSDINMSAEEQHLAGLRTMTDTAWTVLLGREEYVVRAVDAHTGMQRWNVSFARLQQLDFAAKTPVADAAQHGSSDGAAVIVDTPALSDDGAPAQPDGVVVFEGDNAMSCVNHNGWQKWRVQLHAPPVVAFLSDSSGKPLLPMADVSSRQLPALPSYSQPSAAAAHGSAAGEPEMVVVGSINDSPYALPYTNPQDDKCAAAQANNNDDDDDICTPVQAAAVPTNAASQLVEVSRKRASDPFMCPLGVHSVAGQSTAEQLPWMLSSVPQPQHTHASQPPSMSPQAMVISWFVGVLVACGLFALSAVTYMQYRLMFDNRQSARNEASIPPPVRMVDSFPSEYSASPVRKGSSSSHSYGDAAAGMQFVQPTQRMRDGRVGRMEVMLDRKLGVGSGGTIVFEGRLDGRPVAVKRLLRQFNEAAIKEINALILSDEHPNVLRCFAMEEDDEFVYLALERCLKSLAEFVEHDSCQPGFEMVGRNQLPTALCQRISHDIAQGLAALHEKDIVHRDVKPHNVLLTDKHRAKLSDMGLSKQLVPNQSSFISAASGSSGWQAPECILCKGEGSGRQTKAVDVFSLACLLFYCWTGGKHPFGEGYERDAGIVNGQPQLDALKHMPEAISLLRPMLSKDPRKRPAMQAVLAHPVWWSSQQRLDFLIACSNRVEGEDREIDLTLISELESCSKCLGVENWGAFLDAGLVSNLGPYRRYNFKSLRDLLRIIRNKHNHFRELPADLQSKLGPLPDGYLQYFTHRFPNLLMTMYRFALSRFSEDEDFARFFPPGAFDFPYAPLRLHAATPHQQQQDIRTTAMQATTSGTSSQPDKAQSQPVASALHHNPVEGSCEAAARAQSTFGRIEAADAHAAVVQTDSNGSDKANRRKQFKRNAAGFTDANTSDMTPTDNEVIVGWRELVAGDDGWDDGIIPAFPRHEEAPACDFYVKTGHCGFGEECYKDHPPQYAVKLNSNGFPMRPEESKCKHYMLTGTCKYKSACKFHHPNVVPIFAGEQAP